MTGRNAFASRGRRRWAGLAFLALLLTCGEARAQCVLIPTPGNDVFTCSSGVSGSLTDLQGNNTLIFPALGTGTIAGNVLFGNGNDRVEMHSGSITGTVDTGDGADSIEISAGTILGSVTQGAGIDSFIMTGGQIASLFQGDGLDVFLMSGGTIVGAFEDGDAAVMTGGTIGRVDMNLANNVFNMSGGTILGNLVTGFGNDTIGLSGGLIGGNLSVSGGTDLVAISGGRIAGEIRMSTGNDVLLWVDGGIINGAILMAGDNDRATLRNLSLAETSATPVIDGGTEADTLVLDNSSAAGAGRFINWESIALTRDSVWTLTGNAVLGDAGTGTGVMAVDGSSTMFGGGFDAGVAPFIAGQIAVLTNAGSINLTNAGGGGGDRFTVFGNYIGAGGTLVLDTVLAGDGAPSDRLVISQGTATGWTRLTIVNRGGGGAPTVVDGIEVVEAIGGATTANGAFSLNRPVAAGALEYFLFKGGVTPGTGQNWYLRSSLVAGPIAAPGTPFLPRGGGEAIPLYRLEVPVYSALSALARELTRSAVGTFHERRGDQFLAGDDPSGRASWGRIFGERSRQSWSGTVDPRFDGTIAGFQAGHDLARWDLGQAGLARAGFLAGQARLRGDVNGDALARRDVDAGDVKLTGNSFGGYWTQMGQPGWYVEAVGMATALDADAHSRRNFGIGTDGSGGLFSLEGGYPVGVGFGWVLEPQAQVIWQDLSLDDTSDPFARIGFSPSDGWTGRIGSRLSGGFGFAGLLVRPHVEINFWKDFASRSKVTFDSDAIVADSQAPAFEVGGGLSVALGGGVSLYGTADYLTGLGEDEREAYGGNLGLRVVW
ncbi:MULTISPECIES: autotransporter outer membrane beta-barrel domain-containing protein [Rhodomicrobium]|uniref:autotransporter family protein n=1 Tax=Rhodomicrobium TaxID=1068 RepID=UPI000F735671|nr:MULTISPECIES: autotransporter outer membrane beta-barrel domain-containing protein [Rhodomicrobium]